MKKTIIISCIVVILIVLVSFLTYIDNFSYKSIKEDYYNFIDKINKEDISISEKYHELSNIFNRISKGTKGDQRQFAELLRVITNDSFSFYDAEVFEIARTLSEFYDELAAGNDTSGIESITITEKDHNSFVSIDYINVKKYNTQTLSTDDKEIYGEHYVEYDGKLGKYRVQITFFDSKPSKKFTQKYKTSSVYELDGSSSECTFKFKWVYNADHGFVIYIGSDQPLDIFEDTVEITSFKGTIDIALN